MKPTDMYWEIISFWPLFLTYALIMAPVLLYRFFKKKRRKIKPSKQKAAKEAGDKGILTFQEFLLSLAFLGLAFNFFSIEMDRLNTEKSIESYEVINRPYIFIRKIDGEAEAGGKVLKCSAAIINTGSVPGFNTTIEGSVTCGGVYTKSEDSFDYAAVYPESIIWTGFRFPIDEERPVDIEYKITYSDYRGYIYEYITCFYYDWQHESFVFEKSDETITKP